MSYRRRIDTQKAILLQRPRIFIRHTDARLLMVSYALNTTIITEIAGMDGTRLVARFDGRLAFDGHGWDLHALMALLDGCIGRVCRVCGGAITAGKTYCKNGCRQSAYRARKGSK